jgi:hypothetical protein
MYKCVYQMAATDMHFHGRLDAVVEAAVLAAEPLAPVSKHFTS